jgi:hypothetical protein
MEKSEIPQIEVAEFKNPFRLRDFFPLFQRFICKNELIPTKLLYNSCVQRNPKSRHSNLREEYLEKPFFLQKSKQFFLR